jgi:hypothetical protein
LIDRLQKLLEPKIQNPNYILSIWTMKVYE